MTTATSRAISAGLCAELRPAPASGRTEDRASDSGRRVRTPARDDPDAELARRAAVGDDSAFTEIVLLYGDRVRSIALRMLGDRGDAEDLAQEVFVSVYSALPRFRGEAKLSTWIIRIARNHCLNRIKAKRRRYLGSERLNHEAACLQVVPGVSGTTHGPEAQVISTQTLRAIEAAMLELEPEQRWLVVLRDVEGLSYEEIADTTGLRIGTVKSRLHRTRAKLARSLADELGGDRGHGEVKP